MSWNCQGEVSSATKHHQHLDAVRACLILDYTPWRMPVSLAAASASCQCSIVQYRVMPILVREGDASLANFVFDQSSCMRIMSMVVSAAQIAYMAIEVLGFEISKTALVVASISAFTILFAVRSSPIADLLLTVVILATYALVLHFLRHSPTPSWLPVAVIFAVWRSVEFAIQLLVSSIFAEAQDRDNAIDAEAEASAERRIAASVPLTTFAELATRHDQCPICIAAFDDTHSVRRLPCEHVFHAACLDPWMKAHDDAKCPVCRRGIFRSA